MQEGKKKSTLHISIYSVIPHLSVYPNIYSQGIWSALQVR